MQMWDPRIHEATATDMFNVPVCADMLGVSRRQVTRWRSKDQIQTSTADEYAVRLGVHPFEVWGREWLHPGNYAAAKAESEELNDGMQFLWG